MKNNSRGFIKKNNLFFKQLAEEGGITKVTFDVDNIIKTEQLIKDSQWIDNFIKINENSFSVSLPREDVYLLNKYLVENKIEVNSIVPLRSLEEYFLNITANQN